MYISSNVNILVHICNKIWKYAKIWIWQKYVCYIYFLRDIPDSTKKTDHFRFCQEFLDLDGWRRFYLIFDGQPIVVHLSSFYASSSHMKSYARGRLPVASLSDTPNTKRPSLKVTIRQTASNTNPNFIMIFILRFYLNRDRS